ncbi:sugar phosphate isomerase/epimerase family protein [Caldanaerobius polysaccharolyticus]|uniref:sugar phosphate isomerase/epimerase family protein n=1 Tax=Caldanaerobius polysaccharolyticus TaxID=44256 RepID=UPI00047D61D1|nr:sugar phosphate isomerase/epimerase [Caldanaerobius polysaccharolyticus]
MKVGYMTNAWGDVVGHPAGVTSVKDLFYLSTGSIEEAVKSISRAGYEMIEIFDGNLAKYANNKKVFNDFLKGLNLKLLAVYSGANFIFDEILEDEFYKLEKAASLAAEFGAKHFVVGGGAIRSKGIKEDDYKKLAEGLDRVMELSKKYGLIASYHPHLGTITQGPDQLDKLMSLTKIDLCPDTGHIEAGGGDSAKVVEKYKERIKYIHLKDYYRGGFYPLGKGQVNFDSIINTLLNCGHEVDFTVEADGYNGAPEEAANESSKYLSRIFK